jgi:hypothetical protein
VQETHPPPRVQRNNGSQNSLPTKGRAAGRTSHNSIGLQREKGYGAFESICIIVENYKDLILAVITHQFRYVSIIAREYDGRVNELG